MSIEMKPYNGDEQYIFISYAHVDRGKVMPILDWMNEHGFRTWYDEGIDPGTEWDENIATHIERSRSFIAFISKGYILSDNCKDELNYARDLKKDRILIYLEDVMLPHGMAMRLNRIQAVFMHKYAHEEEFYERLLNIPMLQVCQLDSAPGLLNGRQNILPGLQTSSNGQHTSEANQLSDIANDSCSNETDQIQISTQMQDIEQRIMSYEPFWGEWYLDNPPQIIGRGSMGSVYLGHSDDVHCALKVISIPKNQMEYHALLNQENGSLAQLKTRIDQELSFVKAEIKLVDRLKYNSHIVPFEDIAIIRRKDIYAFDIIIREELLVGLSTFLSTCERYGFRRGRILYARIWQELTNALCDCERHKIVHGNINPGNIYYAEPSRDYFKLANFSTSVRISKSQHSTPIVFGSNPYMAPEVFTGKGCDTRSDIYSLARVIFELFNDDKSSSKNYSTKLVNPENLFENKKSPIKAIDSELWTIMQRCLMPNPNDRYPTAQALYDDLERYRLNDSPSKRKRLFDHWPFNPKHR